MKRGNNNVFKLSGNLALGGGNQYISNQNMTKLNSYGTGGSTLKKSSNYPQSYQNTYEYDYKQKSGTSQKRKYNPSQQQNGLNSYNSGVNYGNSYKKIDNNYQNVLNKIQTTQINNYGGSYKDRNSYNAGSYKEVNSYKNPVSRTTIDSNKQIYGGYQKPEFKNKANVRSKINQNLNNQYPKTNNRPPINNPKKSINQYRQQEYQNQYPIKGKSQVQIKQYDPSSFKMCRQGCGRKFNPDSILKHQSICKKVFQNKRKQFNAQQKRIVQKEQKKFMKQGELVQKKLQQKKKVQIKKQNVPKWKAQSLGFRAILKANRRGGQMTQQQKKLVNQAQQSSMVKCKFCGRSFSQKAAQRHIPFCQNQQKRNVIKKKK